MTSPHPADDLHTDSLEPDWDLFSQVVAPALGQRVHGFEDLDTTYQYYVEVASEWLRGDSSMIEINPESFLGVRVICLKSPF